jgi:hypothetical protein
MQRGMEGRVVGPGRNGGESGRDGGESDRIGGRGLGMEST